MKKTFEINETSTRSPLRLLGGVNHRPALFGILVLLMLGLATACDKTKKSEVPPPQQLAAPAWSEYLSEHTAGQVSRNSDIRIRFAQDVVPKNLVGKNAAELISISPSVEGSPVYRSINELVLRPKKALVSGQRYTVKVNPSALKGLPDDLDTYEFNFVIIKQDFEITLEGLTSDNPKLGTMRLVGELTTADDSLPKGVKQVLSVTLGGKNIALKWSHQDSRTHAFTLAGLKRTDKEQKLVLSWKGEPISVDSTGTREVIIPPISSFRITKTRLVDKEANRIEVIFSDALDPNQDLTGLLQLDKLKLSTRISENLLTVYVNSPVVGQKELVVNGAIKSLLGQTLGENYKTNLTFRRKKPQVKFSGRGVILPNGARLEIPIESINISSVQVTAFKIYENNIPKFLQANSIDGSQGLMRVGRHLWRRTIGLPQAEQDLWTRHSLDVTELVKAHPGAMLRLTVSFNRGNLLYPCTAADKAIPVPPPQPLRDMDGPNQFNERSSWDFAEEYYQVGNQYKYKDRENPCRDGFYRFGSGYRTARNFIASNIGLLAKQGSDGSLLVLATDIKSGGALAGVTVEARNYQDQILAKLKTDSNGLATAKLSSTPFYILASKDGQKGYLKVVRSGALPTSHFEVGGQAVKEGVKGLLYGERDVWRPGDDMHLTFALYDPLDAIPDKHPATLHLISPKGQIVSSLTNRKPIDGFYAFKLRTAEDAPTGKWTAKALVGDKSFQRTVKIETVIPNRLSAQLTVGDGKKPVIANEDVPFKLKAAWLHGAKASGLKADVSVQYIPVTSQFTRFNDFIFDDPTRGFFAKPVKVWEGNLDGEGNADFNANMKLGSKPPGQLKGNFLTRITEPSGAFSSVRSQAPVQAYKRYVGLRLPKGDAKRNMLLTDKTHIVELAGLTAEDEKANIPKVEVSLYKLNWLWWWDKSANQITNFNERSFRNRVANGSVAVRNGRGRWEFEIKYPQWGRFLLRACDTEMGHCTGRIFYIDWPGWAGKAQEQAGSAASVLNLSTNKTDYKVGETAVITLPSGVSGRALLTLENGTRVVDQQWLRFKGERRPQVRIPITSGMAPNVYASITLMQPHGQRENDRPIRLYGIVPLLVEDPKTRLKPQMATKDVWAPRSQQQVEVKEANGKPMTYTLAVVDEGLLGLTSFKTPDLHKAFYQREALGVLTWDLFDQVVGAYGADLERLLSLGGGEGGKLGPEKAKQRRFPPVVRFYGPFKLAAGAKAIHQVQMPHYIGAVRVMVVAGRKQAFGFAEKEVKVHEPVSILVTMPRALGPGEEVDVPVAVFAYDPKVKKVKVNLKTGGGLEIVGDNSRELAVSQGKEALTRFRVKVAEQPGRTAVSVQAVGGGHKTEDTTGIEIRMPSLPEIKQFTQKIEPGKSWEHPLQLHGMEGTNKVDLSVSSVPPFGLDYRLGYLVRYPYGCVEQTTSAAFPQVYLPKLAKLTPERLKQVENNVAEAIGKLRSFQNAQGAFSYWPGAFRVHGWANIYAGHFLVEAKRVGYTVPDEMMTAWLDHAADRAQEWTKGGRGHNVYQAYRLYVLALANKADIGAMNRLREVKSLGITEHWLLAATYGQVGMGEVAQELLRDSTETTDKNNSWRYNFGSRLRDRAILLLAFSQAGMEKEAGKLAKLLATTLAGNEWHSTQSLGFALASLGRYVLGDKDNAGVEFSYAVKGGSTQDVSSTQPLASVALKNPEQGNDLTVKNDSSRPLYATVTVVGNPPPGQEKAAEGKLSVKVRYYEDSKELTVESLNQGKDITAEVTVRNNSGRDLDQLALRHLVPLGWEILGGRLDTEDSDKSASRDKSNKDGTYDYRDVRDDRVNTHFSLKKGEQRDFKLRFNTAYAGRFYAPGIVFEDMYNASLTARTKGQWVEVVKK